MVLEVSYLLGENEPKTSITPDDHFDYNVMIRRGDPCNGSILTHGMHTGSHVDASYHFFDNGRTIDTYPIDRFVYNRICALKFPRDDFGTVTKEDLLPYHEEIAKAEILCIYYGFADFRSTEPERYVDRYPALNSAAAEYIRTEFPNLRAIALDAIGVDYGDSRTHPIHHELLAHKEGFQDLLIFEDINTKQIYENRDRIHTLLGLPVRWIGAEAAPVCMVAICD